MIFFFDIDGTLLYHKEWRVPPSAVYALEQLHARGHMIYLNTSRSPNEMANVAEAMRALPLDGAVLTGGALVMAQGKAVREVYAPADDMRQAMALLSAWHIPVRWQSRNTLRYTAEPSDETHEVLSWLFGFVPEVAPWRGEALMRLVLYAADEQIAELQARFPGLCIAPQGHTLVNITEKHVDKADAMLNEAKRRGFPREQIVAFGDGLNDVDMLKNAGTGIAMGGCPEAVSLAADYTTTPIHQDGIMHALKHFGWIW